MRPLRLLVTILPLLFLSCRPDGGGKVYRIGYMLCNSEQETRARFLPLTRYLSQETGYRFEFIPVDTHEVERRFGQKEFEFTHTNSLLYIVLKERYGVTLLASEKRGKYGVRTGGAIIARKGGGISTLADLKGKRFGFGPMLAPTGFMAEYTLLMERGIDPERDLVYTIPKGSFKHEKVIYGVLFGAYDAAAAPLLDLEEMTREGKISADDITILAETPLVPYCTFAASRDLPPEVVERVRNALLKLTPEQTVEIDGERVRVLKSAWVDGYEAIPDTAYDTLREMARKSAMPPFERY